MADSVEQSVRCGKCGAELAEPVSTPVEARIPCPSCGSTNRAFAVHITESVQVSSHMSALHERQGEAIGFSESQREGRASSAPLRDDGLLDMSLVGSSPQGEEDTPAACQVLKERLNADGAHWDSIIAGREPVDCALVDAHDPDRTLEVQVVRAIASQDLWRQLNSAGSAQKSLSPAAAGAEIRLAIEAKARDMKIPRPMRSKLVLALDATRLPGLAFDAIVRQFRSANMSWTASRKEIKHGTCASSIHSPSYRREYLRRHYGHRSPGNKQQTGGDPTRHEYRYPWSLWNNTGARARHGGGLYHPQ